MKHNAWHYENVQKLDFLCDSMRLKRFRRWQVCSWTRRNGAGGREFGGLHPNRKREAKVWFAIRGHYFVL